MRRWEEGRKGDREREGKRKGEGICTEMVVDRSDLCAMLVQGGLGEGVVESSVGNY